MPEHLAAPLVSLALFLTWGAIGAATLSVLRERTNVEQNLLLAPAVGAGVSVLPLFWLSWSGLPVSAFGAPLAGVLLIVALAVLWRQGYVVSPRELAVFAAPLAAAFALTGWPLVKYGFAWLSYANDDMVNYCLLAERLLHNGLLVRPSAEALASGTDLSLASWFIESATARPGSQLVLAWVATIVRRPLPELFMPVIIALHLALVASAGALVYQTRHARRAAVATCWLVAFSPLTTLGTVSQLIAQVFGLALASSLVALAWDAPSDGRPGSIVRESVLLSVAISAFLLVYPEFAPFVGVALVGRIALGVIRRSLTARQAITLTLAGAGSVLLIAPYAVKSVTFFLIQARQGMTGSERLIQIFPYYLIPSGLAQVWGFLPIAGQGVEPWTSLTIAAGGVLLLATFVWSVRLFFQGEAVAAVALPMFLVGLVLFWQPSPFGLFKLAMFAQPFLLGTVAVFLTRDHQYVTARVGRAMLFALALSGVINQNFYMRSSIDNQTMSRGAILNQIETVHVLRRIAALAPPSLHVDFANMVLVKLQSLYTKGIPVRFISHDFALYGPNRRDPLAVSTRTPQRFDVIDPADPSRSIAFTIQSDAPPGVGLSKSRPRCESLLTAPGAESILNRFRYPPDGDTVLAMKPCSAVRNHLVFISTPQGRHYSGYIGEPIAIHGLERDYFFPARTMAGLGRYLVFEVLNPSPSVRVLLDLTASLKGDGASALPPVHAIGQTRVPFEVVGRGSARLYSPPLVPRTIDGRHYIALDLGVDGTRYPDTRRGLMALFGRTVTRDAREIVAIARDISLVSESEYTALRPPSRLTAFPDDLANPTLEYSGIYEDGWLGENARLNLRRPATSNALVIKGTIRADPPHGGRPGLKVLIDGQEAARIDAAGPFEVRAPLVGSETRSVNVSLQLSGSSRLSPYDRRPASAHLDYLGFE